MYKNASLASEAEKLHYGLSCTRRPWLLNRSVTLAPSRLLPLWEESALTCLWCRFLHYSLDPDKVSKEYTISTITFIGDNAVGQPLAWNFVRAKWDDLVSL